MGRSRRWSYENLEGAGVGSVASPVRVNLGLREAPGLILTLDQGFDVGSVAASPAMVGVICSRALRGRRLRHSRKARFVELSGSAGFVSVSRSCRTIRIEAEEFISGHELRVADDLQDIRWNGFAQCALLKWSHRVKVYGCGAWSRLPKITRTHLGPIERWHNRSSGGDRKSGPCGGPARCGFTQLFPQLTDQGMPAQLAHSAPFDGSDRPR